MSKEELNAEEDIPERYADGAATTPEDAKPAKNARVVKAPQAEGAREAKPARKSKPKAEKAH